MGHIPAEIGQPAPLQQTLADGRDDRFVRAHFFKNSDHSPVAQVDLDHVYEGLYLGSYTHTVQEDLTATFIVYTDSGYTVKDPRYEQKSEIYKFFDVRNTTRYRNDMSTVYQDATGTQDIVAWAERNDQLVLDSEDCTVFVKNSFGALMWTDNMAEPNSDGVYHFNNPVILTPDTNYYIIIIIKVDGEYRVTTQTFFTVD